MHASATVDAIGTLCPVPILRAADRIRGMRTGEVLEVLATDEAILEDLPAWCRALGHEFLGFEIELPLYRGYARKRKEARGDRPEARGIRQGVDSLNFEPLSS